MRGCCCLPASTGVIERAARRMTALDHSRQKWMVRATSAFTATATEPRTSLHVANVLSKGAQQFISEFPKFSLPIGSKSLHNLCRPGPDRGAFRDRHERRVGMRWTRAALKTRAPACGRRSRVVLTPRRWRQVLEKQASCKFSWGRRWQTSPVTGESAKQPLKPLRAGMPGVPVRPW
jgi:hypothetical protein